MGRLEPLPVSRGEGQKNRATSWRELMGGVLAGPMPQSHTGHGMVCAFMLVHMCDEDKDEAPHLLKGKGTISSPAHPMSLQ